MRHQGDTTDDSVSEMLSMYFDILTAVQDQIRFADQKAAFLFGANALLFGSIAKDVLASQVSTSVASASWCRPVGILLLSFAALHGGSVLFTFLFTLRAVWPRLGQDAPKTKLFFGHIARDYAGGHHCYAREMVEMTPAGWAHEIGTQVSVVSGIAMIKHNSIRIATLSTAVSFVSWALTLILLGLRSGSHW